jgi:hypothetical protein
MSGIDPYRSHFLSSKKAHPAKAGVAKQRVLASSATSALGRFEGSRSPSCRMERRIMTLSKEASMRLAPGPLTAPALLFGMAFLISGCGDSPTSPSTGRPLSAQAPADGNGNKQIVTYNFDVPGFQCPGGAELSLHVGGWVQIRTFSNGSRVELDVYHVIHTWSNSAGETFVDHEIGPDHFYIDKNTGNLILASTGKLTYAGIMGRLVTDLTTGQVIFVTGPGFPDHLQLACAALT